MAVKFWPWSRPEVRESYTDQVICADHGERKRGERRRRTGRDRNRRSMVGQLGLASATVKPDSRCAQVCHALRTRYRLAVRFAGPAKACMLIDVRGGRVTLTPTASWSVHGSDDPSTWLYRVNLSGPDSTRTVTLPQTSVLHVRYAPSPDRPWAGRSPVALALATSKAASLLETATAGELGFTQTQMLTPRRAAGDFGVAETLAPDTLSKIVSAFSEHVNVGAFVLPADVTPSRLGPEPPDSFPLLRDRLENAMYAMHGIPPALIAAQGTGTAMREAFRQVLHSLLKPLGAIIAEELREKLDPAAALDFSELRAGDIVGTSRALGSLVKAGLTPQAAAAIVGLDDIEVSA